jgi:thymidylate synthase (FAD)
MSIFTIRQHGHLFQKGSGEEYAELISTIKTICHQSYTAYTNLLARGMAKEVSRVVLPLNIFSSCYVTHNLRSLMNFLSLRTSDSGLSRPQAEIEEVAKGYENCFKEYFPKTWQAFCSGGRVSP